MDLLVWWEFLHRPSVFTRPFADFNSTIEAAQVDMYSDATRNFELGFAATCYQSWCYNQWDIEFMKRAQPSIEYLDPTQY